MSHATAWQRRCARSLAALALCSLVSCGAAAAEEAKIDPAAQKVVDAFGKYYAGLKGFRLAADVKVVIARGAQEQEQQFSQQFSVQRPNELAFKLDAQGIGASVVSNGKDLSMYIQGYGKYATEAAPATLEDLLKNQIVFGILGMGNAQAVTVALFSDDPGSKLLENVTTLEYGGIEELEGAKCHLLKAQAEQLDWQIWIDAGEQPLVRQFLPDVQKAIARLAEARGQKSPFADVKVTNTVSYKDWEIDPKFASDAFAFKAPEDATEVDSFAAILGQPAAPEPAAYALLGKPAPPIKLELLDGGELNLASFKDKHVVILDFWATWCGPCVQAMPIIEKVAAKYEDQGVRLFAVNLQEGPDEIRAFLDESKLDVAVALDKQGAVAAAYMANAIPQTVLVGKDGTVQVVKVGLTPGLEATLSEELEALLAGKDLAAEKTADSKQPADKAAGDAAP